MIVETERVYGAFNTLYTEKIELQKMMTDLWFLFIKALSLGPIIVGRPLINLGRGRSFSRSLKLDKLLPARLFCNAT
jgi:hypothetical protein